MATINNRIEDVVLDDSINYLINCKYSPDLIYIDPPFNTGKVRTLKSSEYSYDDSFENYREWLQVLCDQAYKRLSDNGSFFLHLDAREVHYAKVDLDDIFGRNNFMNEIIWCYDFGGRSKNKWSWKHDNILWYVKDKKNYIYNYDQMDRIPYMAPGLCGEEKARKGKTPTDVWWNTIVPTNGKERVGYPTQKPLSILERIIKIHSNPDDLILDVCAGSGTTGVAAKNLGRQYILVDKNPQAIEVIKERLYGN